MTEKLKDTGRPDGWNLQIRGRQVPPDWSWERTTTNEFVTVRFDSEEKSEWWIEVTLSREELEFILFNMDRCQYVEDRAKEGR